MCDHSAYHDPLPDRALEALKHAGIRPTFVSRAENGAFTMEVSDPEFRRRAFRVLATAFPKDEDWLRLHLCGPYHRECMNCSRRKRP